MEQGFPPYKWDDKSNYILAFQVSKVGLGDQSEQRWQKIVSTISDQMNIKVEHPSFGLQDVKRQYKKLVDQYASDWYAETATEPLESHVYKNIKAIYFNYLADQLAKGHELHMAMYQFMSLYQRGRVLPKDIEELIVNMRPFKPLGGVMNDEKSRVYKNKMLEELNKVLDLMKTKEKENALKSRAQQFLDFMARNNFDVPPLRSAATPNPTPILTLPPPPTPYTPLSPLLQTAAQIPTVSSTQQPQQEAEPVSSNGHEETPTSTIEDNPPTPDESNIFDVMESRSESNELRPVPVEVQEEPLPSPPPLPPLPPVLETSSSVLIISPSSPTLPPAPMSLEVSLPVSKEVEEQEQEQEQEVINLTESSNEEKEEQEEHEAATIMQGDEETGKNSETAVSPSSISSLENTNHHEAQNSNQEEDEEEEEPEELRGSESNSALYEDISSEQSEGPKGRNGVDVITQHAPTQNESVSTLTTTISSSEESLPGPPSPTATTLPPEPDTIDSASFPAPAPPPPTEPDRDEAAHLEEPQEIDRVEEISTASSVPVILNNNDEEGEAVVAGSKEDEVSAKEETVKEEEGDISTTAIAPSPIKRTRRTAVGGAGGKRRATTTNTTPEKKISKVITKPAAHAATTPISVLSSPSAAPAASAFASPLPPPPSSSRKSFSSRASKSTSLDSTASNNSKLIRRALNKIVKSQNGNNFRHPISNYEEVDQAAYARTIKQPMQVPDMRSKMHEYELNILQAQRDMLLMMTNGMLFKNENAVQTQQDARETLRDVVIPLMEEIPGMRHPWKTVYTSGATVIKQEPEQQQQQQASSSSAVKQAPPPSDQEEELDHTQENDEVTSLVAEYGETQKEEEEDGGQETKKEEEEEPELDNVSSVSSERPPPPSAAAAASSSQARRTSNRRKTTKPMRKSTAGKRKRSD